MEKRIRSKQAEVEALEKRVKADERWLRASASYIDQWNQQLEEWTRAYPLGLPSGIYERAIELQAKLDDAVPAHNRKVEEARADLAAYEGASKELEEIFDAYDRNWQELKRVTADLNR